MCLDTWKYLLRKFLFTLSKFMVANKTKPSNFCSHSLYHSLCRQMMRETDGERYKLWGPNQFFRGKL